MKTNGVLLFLCAAVFLLAGCGTSPKSSVADEPFERFYARMVATYAPEAVSSSRRIEAGTQQSTNAATLELAPGANEAGQTNQSRFVLPPPFLQLPEQRAAREEVQNSGVVPALVQKMLQGGFLTLAEIQELVQHKVSETNLVNYLRSTGANYTLTTRQIDELRAASVSDAVIDYLLSTPALHRTLYYPPPYPLYTPPYFHQPYYPSWDLHHYHNDLHHDDGHHDHH